MAGFLIFMPTLNLTTSGFMAILIPPHIGHDISRHGNRISRNLLTRTGFLRPLNRNMTPTDANRVTHNGGNVCFIGQTRICGCRGRTAPRRPHILVSRTIDPLRRLSGISCGSVSAIFQFGERKKSVRVRRFRLRKLL